MLSVKYSNKQKQKVIQNLLDHDIGYIKFEYEGNSDYSDYECDYCSSGERSCSTCDGDGVVLLYDRSDNEYSNDCIECDGSGYITCDECGGASHENGFDELEYQVFKNITDEERSAINYYRFYVDGSVNTELTVTVPVQHIDVAVKLQQRFNSHMDNFENAGLHIALLPISSRGVYPNYEAVFDNDKIENFKEQATKLLPALYLLASNGEDTRGLDYRKPQISKDKYSAIHLCNISSSIYAVEFRVFDPSASDMLWYNIDIMARAWEYYSLDKTVDITRNKMFIKDYNREIRAWYNDLPNYQAMTSVLGYLKPDTITLKQLREYHGISDLSMTYLRKKAKQQERLQFQRYTRYVNNIHHRACVPVDKYELDKVAIIKSVEPKLAKVSNDTLIRRLRNVDVIKSFTDWLLENYTTPSYDYVV